MRRSLSMCRGAGLWTVACLALATHSFGGPVSDAANRPNIVLIIADDAGRNDFGAYGHSSIQTEHIDRLAAEGLRFTEAYLTTSSCSPTRCSLITGRYPHNTGAEHLKDPLPEDRLVFPEMLREGGYYTAAAGKWHMGPAPRKHFDRIEHGTPSGAEYWLEVLKERPKDQPFFFWFAAYDPHRGYEENTIPEPHGPDDVVLPPFLPDDPRIREGMASYYDEIGRLDDNVGRVVDELRRQGELGNTVILFISDNGRPFPRSKTTLYDSGIQTPLIIHWPEGLPDGRSSDALVSVIDLAPTILDLVGERIPETMQGRSMRPVLEDPDATIRDYAFAEHNWHGLRAFERSARDARFLYIWNARPDLPRSMPGFPSRETHIQVMEELFQAGELNRHQREPFIYPRPKEELYDTRADPFQLRNLADHPAYADVLERMRRALQGWRRETDDTKPTWDSMKPNTIDRFFFEE